MGGFHLVRAPEPEVRRVARVLLDELKIGRVARAHCTSERGFAVLQELFGPRFDQNAASLLPASESADQAIQAEVTPTSFAGAAGRWKNLGQSAWFAENGVYRQAYGTRSLTGASTNDHVVQVRVRPTAFNGADRWVGLLARYENDSNYVYVTLRSSNVLSLRRLSFGQIEVLDEQPLTVTPNTWYTLRLEKIGNKLRVYVNDTLRISAEDNVGLPGGRVGLLTYKAAADFDDFIAYQP
jgi:hypothetical protein